MESMDDSNKNFFKHVFNFDNDSKSEMLNIIQYALIGIIPVVLLNKLMSKYVPEADDKKSSLELVAEVIIQVIVMFIGLLIIQRIVTFVPTYSGAKYPDFSIIIIILSTLMITLSLQTKLGEKVNILIERIVDLWEGTTDKKKNKNKNKKSTQQPQNSAMPQQTPNQAAMNQSLYTDGTAIHSLPSTESSSDTNLPNYNNLYRQDNTPLVGAATPGQTMEGFSEPMAANAALGTGAFGSW